MFEKISKLRKVAVASLTALSMSGVASAGYSFSNVTDVISATVDIFPPILELVVAIFPILVVITIIGFLVGLFDGILGGLRGKLRGL